MNVRSQTIIGQDGLPTNARVGDEFKVIGSARIIAIEETMTVEEMTVNVAPGEPNYAGNVAPGEPNYAGEQRATLQLDVTIS